MPGHLRRGAVAVSRSRLTLWRGGAADPAVNADHGNQVVSREPGQLHAARDERLGQRDHPDRQQDHRGRDVHLREPAGTFGNTGDDVVRNRIFAFDATTGAIDPAFNPNLGGAANSLTPTAPTSTSAAASARSAATARSSASSS